MTGLLPGSVELAVGGTAAATGAVYAGYAVARRRQATLLARRLAKMMSAVVAFWALFGVSVAFEVVGTGAGVPEPATLLAGAGAVAATWCGSWFMNDVYDEETDKHANAHRATAQGKLSGREIFGAATVLWVVGLAFAAAVGSYALAGAVWMILINLLYSVPPIRLKSGPVSSMVSAGLMGVAGVMIGSGTVVSVPEASSIRLAGVVFLFMTLNMSYKDLKDAEHDAKTGVENFVVKLGRERATKFLMVSLPASYVVGGLLLGVTAPVALGVFLLLGLAVSGVLYVSDTSTVRTLYKVDAVNAAYLAALMAGYAGFIG